MQLATSLIRSYARRRLARLSTLDPVAAQERELLGLVNRARNTAFGRDHRFAEIGDVAAFQDRVPIRTYEDFWRDYWSAPFPRLTDVTWPGLVRLYAITSGTTTGASKYIPLTRGQQRANSRAALEVLVHHIAARPNSQVLGGKALMLGGSSALTEHAPGIFSGDLSGIVAKKRPWWARSRYFPPPDIALLGDWDVKLARIAALAPGEDIRSISGTPSWLVFLIQALIEAHPDRGQRAVDFFPELELLVHGAVNFGPYEAQFADFLAGSRAETREVYPASEGFIAVADRGNGEGLRLMVDNGLFFEFIPMEELGSPKPTRHWLANVETGVNYAIVLSSNAGLWGYLIGDTVRFVDRRPPRVLITGRTSYFLSAFGEHLIAEEVETAMAAATREAGLMVGDYAVGALFPGEEDPLGGHLYIVEFTNAAPQAETLATLGDHINTTLRDLNDDYRGHSSALHAPRILSVPPGTFAGWMRKRGKLGGQNKVPRLVSDRDLFADLKDYARQALASRG